MTTFLCQQRTPEGCNASAIYRVHLRGGRIVHFCKVHLDRLVTDMPRNIAKVFRLDTEIDVTGEFVRVPGVEQRISAPQL